MLVMAFQWFVQHKLHVTLNIIMECIINCVSCNEVIPYIAMDNDINIDDMCLECITDFNDMIEWIESMVTPIGPSNEDDDSDDVDWDALIEMEFTDS